MLIGIQASGFILTSGWREHYPNRLQGSEATDVESIPDTSLATRTSGVH